MKRTISFLLCALMVLAMASLPAYAADAPVRVVTTNFPPYDFIRQIAGDNVELTMLLKPGAESHSFEPSPQDIIAIQKCDIFIRAGGDDTWVDRILESMDTSNIRVLTMMDMVEAVEEEIVEGMEDDHDHGHEEAEFDPSKVYDRQLTEWTGSWKSLHPYLSTGLLDDYVRADAESKEISFEENMEKRLAGWKTDDFDVFMIAGDKVYIDTGDKTYSGTYSYEGYTILEKETGVSVWYQYALSGDAEGMPLYIAMNDHGMGTAPEGEHDDEGEEHEDEHGHDDHDHGVAHTHMRYGNDSFEALVNIEGWNPFFVDAVASDEQVLDTLTGHSHDHAHMDEHVWTSPRNAVEIVRILTETLCEMDPANAESYQRNAAAYTESLVALDEAFVEATQGAARNTVVFGDRFPFRYLADAYGLSYYAAFTGCSTNTDASASTIAFLIDKVAEEALPVVFKIELSNGLIAEAIAENTGAKVVELHSVHNVSKADFDAGVTYLDLMMRNVDLLREALN